MGLFLGLDRETAAKFSFFLSVPIISAAALFEFLNLIQSDASIDVLNFTVTVFLSTISSFITIYLFLKFINKIGMLPFVIYRIILGILLLYLFI